MRDISTPCIKVCRIEGDYCTGCGRHTDDIRMWLAYSEEKRLELMTELKRGTYKELLAKR